MSQVVSTCQDFSFDSLLPNTLQAGHSLSGPHCCFSDQLQGWISEFTSKIVSRLKVWNACGKLLPVLGGLLCQERGTAKWRSPQSNLPQDGIQNCGIQVESSSTPCPVKESYCWPSPRKVDRFEAGIGPRLHFVVHVAWKAFSFE